MPTDLSPDRRLGTVYVRDKNGIGLPFSRGLMATSILATGIETETAYRIAAQISNRLSIDRIEAIDSDQLVELAANFIEVELGLDVANRYLAWRTVRRSGRPILIAISGAPGVGKSTIATRLAVRLGITRVVTTDTIREVLRGVVSETVLPELHVSSYEHPRLQFGLKSCSLESFHRQASAVGSATTSLAMRLVAERRSAIVEGVHVLPGQLKQAFSESKDPPVIVEALLTLTDETLHRAHLTCRLGGEPSRGGLRHLENFQVIRSLQDVLRQFASRAGIAEYDVAHPEDLTEGIVDQLVKCVNGDAVERNRVPHLPATRRRIELQT